MTGRVAARNGQEEAETLQQQQQNPHSTTQSLQHYTGQRVSHRNPQ